MKEDEKNMFGCIFPLVMFVMISSLIILYLVANAIYSLI